MEKPIIIAIAGGSASGKTTVINEILDAFENKEDILVIRHDDYYLDQKHKTMEERVKTNYDHPNSLENDLLIRQLQDLIDGKEIDKPTYDFVNHTRSDKVEHLKPAKVIILDGILILADKRIRELTDIKVFVECDEDIRLLRRIRRDTIERGRSFDSVVEQYLKTVKPMHYQYIKPTKRFADVVIPNDYYHNIGTDLLITKIKSILVK